MDTNYSLAQSLQSKDLPDKYQAAVNLVFRNSFRRTFSMCIGFLTLNAINNGVGYVFSKLKSCGTSLVIRYKRRIT